MPGLEHPLAEAARREVIALHALFEGWLGGTLPESDEVFARAEASLAHSFTMISPDGNPLARATVLAGLRRAHGAKGRSGPFRIVVDEFQILHLEPPLVAVRYVEDQRQGEARTLRRSTALLRASDLTPSGVEWLALQETWCHPRPERSAGEGDPAQG